MSREFMAEGSDSPEPEATIVKDKQSFLTDRKGERGAVKKGRVVAAAALTGGFAVVAGAAAYIADSPEYQAKLEAQRAAHTQPANPDQGGDQLTQRPPEAPWAQAQRKEGTPTPTPTPRSVERPPGFPLEKWNELTSGERQRTAEFINRGQANANIEAGRETPGPTVGPEKTPTRPPEIQTAIAIANATPIPPGKLPGADLPVIGPVIQGAETIFNIALALGFAGAVIYFWRRIPAIAMWVLTLPIRIIGGIIGLFTRRGAPGGRPGGGSRWRGTGT